MFSFNFFLVNWAPKKYSSKNFGTIFCLVSFFVIRTSKNIVSIILELYFSFDFFFRKLGLKNIVLKYLELYFWYLSSRKSDLKKI